MIYCFKSSLCIVSVIDYIKKTFTFCSAKMETKTNELKYSTAVSSKADKGFYKFCNWDHSKKFPAQISNPKRCLEFQQYRASWPIQSKSRLNADSFNKSVIGDNCCLACHSVTKRRAPGASYQQGATMTYNSRTPNIAIDGQICLSLPGLIGIAVKHRKVIRQSYCFNQPQLSPAEPTSRMGEPFFRERRRYSKTGKLFIQLSFNGFGLDFFFWFHSTTISDGKRVHEMATTSENCRWPT